MTVIFPSIAQLGWLPVQLAAARDCNEEVEMLFPLTSPIPTIPNWSIDGIISHAKFESAKPLVRYLLLLCPVDKIYLNSWSYFLFASPEFVHQLDHHI